MGGVSGDSARRWLRGGVVVDVVLEGQFFSEECGRKSLAGCVAEEGWPPGDQGGSEGRL